MVKSEFFTKQCGCEVGLKLAEIGTKNIREEGLNTRLEYAMVRLHNWQKYCQRGVTGYKRVWRTMCSEWLEWIYIRPLLNEFEIFIWV